jgi:hypothetical protein
MSVSKRLLIVVGIMAVWLFMSSVALDYGRPKDQLQLVLQLLGCHMAVVESLASTLGGRVDYLVHA